MLFLTQAFQLANDDGRQMLACQFLVAIKNNVSGLRF